MKNQLTIILLLIFCKATTAQTLMDKYKEEDFTVSLPYFVQAGSLAEDPAPLPKTKNPYI